MHDRARTLDAVRLLHAFVAKARAEPALRVEQVEALAPVSAAELDAFDAATGRRLPAGLRACFEAGLVNGYVSGAAEFHFGHAGFLTLAEIQEQLEWWADLDLADQLEEELAEHGENEGEYNALQIRLLRHGIPLWRDENTVVVDSQDGTVARFDGGGGPADPICGSIAEFLEHFVGAGLFNYGGADRAHFDAYWGVVKDVVPLAIAPAQNQWLQHLDRWYEGDLTK